MNEAEYRVARVAYLTNGEIDEALYATLNSVVTAIVRFGNLRPEYSPTGQWNDEAAQEIFADWQSDRLIGTGQLARILQEAATLDAMRRIASEAVRRNLIDNLERSQARNIYTRIRKLLEGDETFEDVGGDCWRIAGSAATVWQRTPRELLGYAWSLGEFETIVYRPDAKKLSPLLEASELKRFVVGLLKRTNCAIRASDIVETLSARFGLGGVELEELDDDVADVMAPRPDESIAEKPDFDRAARFAIAELTERQQIVLGHQLSGATNREIAKECGISVGTVNAEQQTIAKALARNGSLDQDGRANLLNAVRDVLFEQ